MLRATWLTILIVIAHARGSYSTSDINISPLFCSKYTFQKGGSRSSLCNVRYSKNKHEDGKAAPRTNPLTLNISFSTEKPGYPFRIPSIGLNQCRQTPKTPHKSSSSVMGPYHTISVNEKIHPNIIPTGYNNLPSCLNWIEFDFQWHFEALINDQ